MIYCISQRSTSLHWCYILIFSLWNNLVCNENVCLTTRYCTLCIQRSLPFPSHPLQLSRGRRTSRSDIFLIMFDIARHVCQHHIKLEVNIRLHTCPRTGRIFHQNENVNELFLFQQTIQTMYLVFSTPFTKTELALLTSIWKRFTRGCSCRCCLRQQNKLLR